MVKTKNQKSEDRQSILYWLVISFVLTFMFIAPFQRGLFNGNNYSFERPIYTALLWGGIALFLLAVYLFKHWRLRSHRDVLSIMIWLIPLSYFLSTLNSVSLHLATNELFIQIFCVVFFLIGAYTANNKKRTAVIQYGFLISGYIVIIYGWMNWLGNANYQDAVLNGRMAGVFQYPNAYAAYVAAMLMINMLFILNTRKWYVLIAHAMMVLPIACSFILTLSRGGLVSFIIVFILFLVFLNWRKQFFVLFYVIVSLGVSLYLTNRMVQLQDQLSRQYDSLVSLKGWVFLILGSILVCGLIYVCQTFIFSVWNNNSQVRTMQKQSWILPAILILITVIGSVILLSSNIVLDILPDNLERRISIDSLFTNDRFIYIQDAVNMIRDYPAMGAGGGAWSRLYEQYQSYPYTSTQTHTFYMKLLIETGITGFILFVFFIGYILFVYLRIIKQTSFSEENELKWMFPVLVLNIIVHSAIDFDMSFVYLSALVFLGIGMMISNENSNLYVYMSKKKMQVFRKLYASFIMILAVILIFNSLQSYRANVLFSEALEVAKSSNNYNEIVRPLNRALEIEANHPEYNLYKYSLLFQLYSQTHDERFLEEADVVFGKLIKSDPYYKQLIQPKYSFLIAQDKQTRAIEWIDENLKKTPLDMLLYEKAINFYYKLGSQTSEQGNKVEMYRFWNQAIGYYDQIQAWNNKLQETKQLKVSRKISLDIGRIYYMLGEYELSIESLQENTSWNFDAQINREIARWYLAALKKQGRNNKRYFEALINEYPYEESKIQELLTY